MGARYRIKQLWQNLSAEPLPQSSISEIESILNKRETELFQLQQLSDQRHSYLVMKSLQDAGEDNTDLLAAALLHDIGKIQAPLNAFQRSLVVAVEKIMPSLMKEWGYGDINSWRKPFVVKERHPALGAILAEKAASTQTTINLIRRHQDQPIVTAGDEKQTKEDHLLSLLQAADNIN